MADVKLNDDYDHEQETESKSNDDLDLQWIFFSLSNFIHTEKKSLLYLTFFILFLSQCGSQLRLVAILFVSLFHFNHTSCYRILLLCRIRSSHYLSNTLLSQFVHHDDDGF